MTCVQFIADEVQAMLVVARAAAVRKLQLSTEQSATAINTQVRGYLARKAFRRFVCMATLREWMAMFQSH